MLFEHQKYCTDCKKGIEKSATRCPYCTEHQLIPNKPNKKIKINPNENNSEYVESLKRKSRVEKIDWKDWLEQFLYIVVGFFLILSLLNFLI